MLEAARSSFLRSARNPRMASGVISRAFFFPKRERIRGVRYSNLLRVRLPFFMGLAVGSAIPIAVAAALLCAAPPSAQNRSNNANPKRLIEKADRLAWLYNWYVAGPFYAEAEKVFEQTGDSRNALFAKIRRLRSEW